MNRWPQCGFHSPTTRSILLYPCISQLRSHGDVDVSQLDVGQTYRVQELDLPDNLELAAQQNYPIISVVGRLDVETSDED